MKKEDTWDFFDKWLKHFECLPLPQPLNRMIGIAVLIWLVIFGIVLFLSFTQTSGNGKLELASNCIKYDSDAGECTQYSNVTIFNILQTLVDDVRVSIDFMAFIGGAVILLFLPSVAIGVFSILLERFRAWKIESDYRKEERRLQTASDKHK